MKIQVEKTKAGKITFRVCYRVAGRRVRPVFHTRDEARAWIKVNRHIGKKEGINFAGLWRGIKDKERHEVLDALALLRTHRVTYPQSSLTLLKAAQAQIAIAEAIQTSITMRQAVELFLISKTNRKRKGSISDGWFRVLEPCLNRMARELPDKTLAEFSTEEIEDYLDDQDWSLRTFNNSRDYLASVFKFAIPKYLKVNPVLQIEKYAKKLITKEVIVPGVPTIHRLLQLVRTKKHRHLKSALDLGFGFAMRSSEISGMRWEDVTEKVIHVPHTIAKNGIARNISRSPLLEGVFRSLLSAKKTGPIAPKGWRRDLTKLFMQAGLGKPRNIVRKSGGSYYYHATGSEPQTQELMGHTEDSNIFSSSYKALNFSDIGKKTPLSQEDGIAYFATWKQLSP